ncbi:MAG: hypothetical protein ACI8PT_002915 [Gammaproteobacteria bacterium]|jgi:hypothetical protein
MEARADVFDYTSECADPKPTPARNLTIEMAVAWTYAPGAELASLDFVSPRVASQFYANIGRYCAGDSRISRVR